MSSGRIATIGTAAGAVGTLGLGAFVARRLLFPTPYTATATVRSASATEAEFVATRDTRLPGTYRLTHDGHHVRVGEVLNAGTDSGTDTDTDTDTVRRRTDALAPVGEWAWDAMLYDAEQDVPGEEPDGADTHVVHVHGQSLGPRQVLRGLAVWRTLGATSEVIDTTDLPLRSLDPVAVDRIVAAVRAARARGVSRVVLQGWSAGALACSVAATREAVDGVVGVSPLLDVRSALRGAVGAARLPRFVGTVAARIATTAVLSRFAGASTPIGVTRWLDTSTPTLLLHSDADVLVASDDVAALARRQDVRAVAFRTAPHTLEWNEDPERWDAAVRDFAARITR
jgi:dienelactone hydrolase